MKMLEERPRMFSEADAIVSYFCARIVGQAVLANGNQTNDPVEYRIDLAQLRLF